MPDFIIGIVANTHGVKGELKVFPVTDDPSRFDLLEHVNIGGKRFDLESVRYQKKMVMLKLHGIDDMSAAEKLKGAEIKIPEELGLPLGEDEYFVRDLYGMSVCLEDGSVIGALSDILSTGANDVYVISAEGKKDVLLPVVKKFVLKIDMKEKTITVRMPEGL